MEFGDWLVAPETAEGAGRASALTIIPYCDGELTIRRVAEEMKPAEIIKHAWETASAEA